MIMRDNLQQPLNSAASNPLNEAEEALQSWGVKYEKNPDGSIPVPGDLAIESKRLTELPDLSAVTVGGSFRCSMNELTSLKGALQAVIVSFDCHNNQLTSLEHAPKTFRGLYSDFGDFWTWEETPRNARLSPETTARLEREHVEAVVQAARRAVVLPENLPVKKPLRLKP